MLTVIESTQGRLHASLRGAEKVVVPINSLMEGVLSVLMEEGRIVFWVRKDWKTGHTAEVTLKYAPNTTRCSFGMVEFRSTPTSTAYLSAADVKARHSQPRLSMTRICINTPEEGVRSLADAARCGYGGMLLVSFR